MINGPENYELMETHVLAGNIGWMEGWPGQKYLKEEGGELVLVINGNVGVWDPSDQELSSQSWMDGPDQPPHP